MKKTAEEIIDKLDEKYGEDNYSILDVVNFTMKELLPEWIKIESEEDLPKDSSNYWIFRSDGRVSTIDHYEVDKKYFFPDLTATHYMPIIKPEPPKKGSEL